MPTATRPMNSSEVFQAVSNVLQDALGIEAEEVNLDATLSGDLGAQSIDLMDIVYRLEKNLGIQVRRSQVFPATDGKENLSNPLTEDLFLAIQNSFDFQATLDHVRVGESTVGEVFTVRLLCQVVAHKCNVQWTDPV